MNKDKKIVILDTLIIFLFCIAIFICLYFKLFGNERIIFYKNSYTAEDFNIDTIKSKIDKDNDGIDDYTDIMLGARGFVKTRPKYDGSYHAGGYPPEGIGVCTDVIWKGFENAGYNLKDLVDEDISNNRQAYPNVEKQDKNIDFRRVKNLNIFFKRYAKILTLDTSDITQWQPGDIVVYKSPDHIAIISDKRNKKGVPYIIHHGGQPILEGDALRCEELVGHYRWEK